MPEARIFKVPERIVEGLFYHHYHHPIPDGYFLKIPSIDKLNNDEQGEWAKKLDSLPPNIIGGNIFSYKFAIIKDDNDLVWELSFYEGIKYFCFILPIKQKENV